MQNRQRKGSGLASAGLRDAEDIAGGKDLGDGLGLDRGGGGVAFVGQRTGEGLSEPEVSKRGQNDCSFMWRCRPRAKARGRESRGLSKTPRVVWAVGCWCAETGRKPGVEQDVEFGHATRKGQQNTRPLMSTGADIAR